MAFEKFIILTGQVGGFRTNDFGIPEEQQQRFLLGTNLDKFVSEFGPYTREWVNVEYKYDGLELSCRDDRTIFQFDFYLSSDWGNEHFTPASVATDRGISGTSNPREVSKAYGTPARSKEGTFTNPNGVRPYLINDYNCSDHFVRFYWLFDPQVLGQMKVASGNILDVELSWRRRSFVSLGDMVIPQAIELPPQALWSAVLSPHLIGDSLPIASDDVTSDPAALHLHPEATSLYRRANTAYRALPERAKNFIAIHSGVRSTERQAELYIAFRRTEFGGPPANRANRPGTSKHEYGLAIDVIRSFDEQRYQKALTETGWSNDIADEGWHFEASSIPSWGKIMVAIDRVRVQYSDPFVNALMEELELEKRIRDGTPVYQESLAMAERERRDLLQLESRLAHEHSRLAAEQQALQQLQAKLQSEQTRLAAKRREVQGIIFRCPNGNPFEQCDHEDLKRDYLERRGKAERELHQLEQNVREVTEEFSARQDRFQRDASAFETGNQQLAQRRTALDRHIQQTELLRQNIQTWEAERAQIAAARPGQVAAIAAAVDAVRAGRFGSDSPEGAPGEMRQ